MNTLATVVGLCGVAMFALSYQLKHRRAIIFFNAGSRILYVAQYFLLGAMEGALLDALAFFISLLCAKSQSGFIKRHFTLTVVLANAAIVALGMLAYKNVFSLLPILALSLKPWPSGSKTSALFASFHSWARPSGLPTIFFRQPTALPLETFLPSFPSPPPFSATTF